MPRKPAEETPEQREKRLARQRAYEARRRERDPEGFKAAQLAAAKKWRENNPEKRKEATKKWREANRDRFNEARRQWRSRNVVRALFLEARSRAKARGVEFSISIDDIPPMGDACPLLGHPFPAPEERRTPYSPSLDRIDASKGYVKGNVWIVGYRANLIKNDGTAEEHEMIAKAMRQRLSVA
ncbi:hypothetical protein K7G19_07245 [Cupriavidus sp. DB3]|uniref:hypothetical protein n=1 Tax=Cupriavidus sp. DB3 TaxID=2873259 RepID=UPI001CF0E574|nr:hypothetical protein [Cupriavidus sp. DB3]MCA7083394.1 hypothetical protein [Cupriavidus sp. DB3]